MASRAVYLVLYRSRDDSELDRLQEYMDRIQALAPGAPMVLVGTHAGERTEGGGGEFRPKRPPSSLFSSFPSLHREPLFVSSMNGYGLEALRRTVLRLALRQPGVGELLPASFVKLRSALRTFFRLLADFGDVLSFEHVPGLEDAVVLRPQWVADVMAHVITMNDAKLRLLEAGEGGGGTAAHGRGGCTGRVAKRALLRLLEDVSPSRAEGLLALLENFSMMHSIDGDTALVPPLLPDASSARGAGLLYEEAAQSPDRSRWRWWSAHYEYSYLPDALLCRLLCRVLALPNLEVLEAWRFGAVTRRNGHLAMVSQGTVRGVDRHVVSVLVCGPRPENLGCLVSAKLRDLLAEAFPGVKLEDIRYGCPHCAQTRQRQPGFFKARLLQRKAANRETVTCEACDGDGLDLSDCLDKDDQAAPWRPERPPPPPPPSTTTTSDSAAATAAAAAAAAAALPPAGWHSQQEALMDRMLALMGRMSAQLSADSATRRAEYSDLRALAGARAEGEEELVRRVTAVARLVAGTDSKPLPSLHVVLPMPSGERPWWDRKGLLKARFRLHLLCEHPGGPHLTDHGGYEIERPSEWLRRYAPGVRLATHALGLLLGAGVRALTSGATDMGLGRLGALVDEHVLNEPLEAFGRLNGLLSSLQQGEQAQAQQGGGGADEEEDKAAAGAGGPSGGSAGVASWQAQHQVDLTNSQEARREIEALVRRQDPLGNYGNLQKVKTRAGDVLWLCKCHALEHVRNNTCW
ncbi:hypothetical protein GPECTOR_19g215 [Gonium pectorale]|uniref:Uncharacterized protein n=1 Tax=Gonium pectorale TaxID=33097 RepID=A0A150GJ15_GONPE|nr:hypothetical protein GPECTOR_19g215 [Gonium pectorale]|eukprot:KXZ49764.1 hypothetical protein GPECTOR_19g215 [Gonium pectorale]